MWWQQYKKEILGNRTELLFLIGAYLLWTLFLLSRIGRWDEGAIIAAYFAPATGIFPLWAWWTSGQVDRQGWRGKTTHRLLCPPAGGGGPPRPHRPPRAPGAGARWLLVAGR